MTTDFKKERIGWIDAYRGFAIILIVIGHIISFGIENYKSSESLVLIRRVITTVWLPAFFWISGYLSYTAQQSSVLQSVFKKAKFLVFPSVAISFFTALLNRGGYSSVYEGFGRYWFTPALFEMWLVYFLTYNIFKKENKVSIWCLLISSLTLNVLPLMQFELNTGLLKSLNVFNLCVYSQFFFFGLLCRLYNQVLSKHLDRRQTVGLLTFSYIIICTLQSVYFETGILSKLFNVVISRYILLALTIVCFYQSRRFLNSDKTLVQCIRFIGRRTLDIYFLHYFFIPDIKWMTNIFGYNEFIIQLPVLAVIAITIIAFCLITSNLLRKSSLVTNIFFGR